jgi:hypothetical protein
VPPAACNGQSARGVIEEWENSRRYMKEIAYFARFHDAEMKALHVHYESVAAFHGVGMFRDVRELITLL